MSKANKGFTILEAVIALAIFAMVITGVTAFLRYVSQNATQILVSRELSDNARIAMDAISACVEYGESVELINNDENKSLIKLTITATNPSGELHEYEFEYDAERDVSSAKYQRLDYGQNELASYIESIYAEITDDRFLTLSISTSDRLGPDAVITAPKIALKRMFDIRGKTIYD